MNENLKKLISSGAIKRAREEDEAKARNEEIRRNQRMENFEDFSDYYGTKPKNIDTTTSTTSTTRFDSTANRNNNYKAAQTGSESAFAVEEAAPSSIKKASGQKAGFENKNNNYANSNVFGSNEILDNKSLPSQNQSFMDSAKTNAVTKTKNTAASKRHQKTNAQRDAEIDKLIDEKFGKGTAERLRLENPAEFQKRMTEVAGINNNTTTSSNNIFDVYEQR